MNDIFSTNRLISSRNVIGTTIECLLALFLKDSAGPFCRRVLRFDDQNTSGGYPLT